MMTLSDTIAISTHYPAFQKLADMAQHRGDLYRLMAVFFSNPSRDLIGDLQAGTLVSDLQQSFAALALDVTHYGDALHALNDVAVACRDNEPAALLTQLRVEYFRLFNASHNPLIPIYETLHRHEPDGTGQTLLFISPTAMAVDRCYRHAGLQMVSTNSPDHLAIECEFLAHLCEKEAAAWQAGDNTAATAWRLTEHTFLNEHLGSWGKELCNQVQVHTQEPFYRCVAALAAIILHMETGAFQPR